MPDVHIPVIGNVPRGGVVIGTVAGAGVLGYVWWKKKTASAATTQQPGTAYAYGYGQGVPSGYYGYGYGYGGMGGGITPYPVGSEYGYGAYGYGYYNPYTGQWLGGGQPPPQPPTPSPGPHPKPPKQVSAYEIADGHMDFQQYAARNHLTILQLFTLNPHLTKYVRSKKPIPRGTKIYV